MRKALLIILLVMPGVIGVAAFGINAVIDWLALQQAYAHFESVAGGGSDLRAVFIAEAAQNIHRLNLFAEGVWTLLCAIYAGLGILGLCLERKNP